MGSSRRAARLKNILDACVFEVGAWAHGGVPWLLGGNGVTKWWGLRLGGERELCFEGCWVEHHVAGGAGGQRQEGGTT